MSFNTCRLGLHSPSKNLCVLSVLVTSFSVKIKVNQIKIIYRSGTKATSSLNLKYIYHETILIQRKLIVIDFVGQPMNLRIQQNIMGVFFINKNNTIKHFLHYLIYFRNSEFTNLRTNEYVV